MSQGSRKGLNSGTQVQEGMDFYKIKKSGFNLCNTCFYRVTCPSTTGICSEKCVVRQFHNPCANVIECTDLGGTTYYTPRLSRTAYSS